MIRSHKTWLHRKPSLSYAQQAALFFLVKGASNACSLRNSLRLDVWSRNDGQRSNRNSRYSDNSRHIRCDLEMTFRTGRALHRLPSRPSFIVKLRVGRMQLTHVACTAIILHAILFSASPFLSCVDLLSDHIGPYRLYENLLPSSGQLWLCLSLLRALLALARLYR